MTPIESLTSRIGKLLAKAENTSSVDESAALFAKAQELASTHAIDMAVARFQHAEGAAPDVLEDRSLTLGEHRTLGLQQKHDLWAAVANANELRYSVARDKTVVYPVGFASDLDTAEHLYAVLVEQMVRLGDEHVRGRSWTDDTYEVWAKATGDVGLDVPIRWRGKTCYMLIEKPVDAKTARRSFYAGYVQAIRRRLLRAKLAAENAAEDRAEQAGIIPAPGELSVTTLALVDKRQRVEEYTTEFYARTRVRGTVRIHRAPLHAASSREGYSAGKQVAMSTRKAIA